MCHALADDAKMPDGTKIPQIIYYQSGVGSVAPTGSRTYDRRSVLTLFHFLFPLSLTPHSTITNIHRCRRLRRQRKHSLRLQLPRQ
jgi:hypothetical protein